MMIQARDRTAFLEKHIENEMQIRRWTPIRYIDNSTETGASMAAVDGHAVIIGLMLSCEEKSMQSRYGKYLLIRVKDRLTGLVVRVFAFVRPYSFRYYTWLIGHTVFVSGKLKYDPHFGFSVSMQILEEATDHSFGIIPVYSKVSGMKDETRDSYIAKALGEEEEDTVPKLLQDKYGLVGINEALQGVMRPETREDILKGKLRMLFDDLFYMAARITLSHADQPDKESFRIETTELSDSVRDHLPFSLTQDQGQAADTLIQHMKDGEPVHALIQGDVGCGKTITAFLPMIAAAENGFQVCMVAPTKILAEQHYQKLTAVLPEGSLDVRLFAGAKIRKKDKQALADGSCKIAIGTHSLLQEGISFANLKLIVVDEEQKFGVEQRQFLLKRQKDTGFISMTATPIPRTLARALYTDQSEIFNIRSMPAGRKPVITRYNNGDRRQVCVDYILKRNEQVYVVCPAIDGFDDDLDDKEAASQIMTTKKAAELYRELFPGHIIETLDGKMKSERTDDVLRRFRDGEIQILVSTTVVEVGVDVPNATLMVLENAERFGLSQMHQLRGRVGRSEKQSYCLLISQKSPQENQRIDTMCRVTDGFRISEIDLKELRHSGDLFGEEQSGLNVYVEEMLRYKPAFDMILADTEALSREILEKHVEKMLLCEIRNHKKMIDPSRI